MDAQTRRWENFGGRRVLRATYGVKMQEFRLNRQKTRPDWL